MENTQPAYWSKKNKPENKKKFYFLVSALTLLILFIFSYTYLQKQAELSDLKIKYDESVILTKHSIRQIKNTPTTGAALFSDTAINNIQLIGIIQEKEKCWAIFSDKNGIQKAVKNDMISKDFYIISSINKSSVTLKQKNKSNSITIGFL